MLPQSLQHILSAYSAAHAPKRWESLGVSAGFSGAAIHRLETDMGSVCLRGWPVGSLPSQRILGLHRLLRHVHEAGLHEVAVPIPALNGETLVTWNDQHWQLEPWLPGRADYWASPSRPRLQHAMSRLALFHQLTQHYADGGPAEQWFFHQEQATSPAVTERLAYLRAWRESKIHSLKLALPLEPCRELRELGTEFATRFESIAPLVGTQLELLCRVRFRLQPCLRDVWHDHVLFTGDQVTGLIDPSACRSENIATDLARLLGSLLNDDRAAWAFALEEYEKHRPLEVQEKALLQALDQSGVLLSGMAWMDRLLLKREQVPHLPKVLNRLDRLAHRLRTLDDTLYGNSWQGIV